ncbi:MAG: hypothetical protein RMJ87_04000 [Cytophagales bacterium]|nr:hypothetical protein [Bernardetiaceae bacterium]MDW8204171.1 hypothetical protein [Cytophagales bacterium]
MQAKRILVPAIFTTLLLHSLCCLLPFLPLAIGASNAMLALASTVAGYQTWLIALQLMLLGVAFYRAYRRGAKRSDRIAFWLPLLLSAVVAIYTWSQHRAVQQVQQQPATFGVKRLQNIGVK